MNRISLKSMLTPSVLAVALTLSLFATGSRASAQTPTLHVVADIPFDFRSGSEMMPAGRYDIQTLSNHILVVRGGTTTFLAPALSMGAIGLITMSGAPESHLGILSREFQIPCIMTAHLSSSESRYEVGNADQAHFDEIVKELNGKQVTLKCANAEVGQVVI